MVHFVADDRVDLVDDLLVCVEVELVVIEANNELRVASVHGLRDRSVNLHVYNLNISV